VGDWSVINVQTAVTLHHHTRTAHQSQILNKNNIKLRRRVCALIFILRGRSGGAMDWNIFNAHVSKTGRRLLINFVPPSFIAT